MYSIQKHYRDDPALRRSFNDLAGKTFGLDFENWYQNGFWGDAYDPYSVVVDGQVVANVSVNRTDLMVDGCRLRLLQLGTVMTAEEYRRRGMIRAILAQIEADFPEVDGIYLFANDSVLDFYPRFGFRRAAEYQYSRPVSNAGDSIMVRIPMETPADWQALGKAMAASRFREGCQMVDNPGLIFFYVSQFMRDCVYCCRALDAWAIAAREGDSLLLHNVFAGENVTLEAVIGAFGREVGQVKLGFAPTCREGFSRSEIREEDTTFFVKGPAFADFSQKGLRIPTLSHA